MSRKDSNTNSKSYRREATKSRVGTFDLDPLGDLLPSRKPFVTKGNHTERRRESRFVDVQIPFTVRHSSGVREMTFFSIRRSSMQMRMNWTSSDLGSSC